MTLNPNGLRGRFGSPRICTQYFYQMTQAILAARPCPYLLVAYDPRPSSFVLKQAIVDAAMACGVDVYDCGVMPTPMLGKWVDDHDCVGMMVTASHNPVEDNGVKIMYHGRPLQDISAFCGGSTALIKGKVIDGRSMVKDYYRQCILSKGWCIQRTCVFDTAHGAWHPHVDILEDMGFGVTLYADELQGDKINQTGSLHIERLSQGCSKDYFVSVDGDGDRLQLARGNTILDGDDMLWHIAKRQQKPVVGTVMSNMALSGECAKYNIPMYLSKVGDCHVRSLLQDVGGRYGAEPCGHFMDIQWLPTSDPVYTLGLILQFGDIEPLAQKMYQRHGQFPNTVDIDLLTKQLSHPCVRTVVRHSKTEPVIRVLLEGDRQLVDTLMLSVELIV